MAEVDNQSTHRQNTLPTQLRSEVDDLANELSQQLTVVAHYVDAYEHMASSGLPIQPESVGKWAQLIRVQLDAGRATIRQLEQLAGHG